jgi:hypothetical protein
MIHKVVLMQRTPTRIPYQRSFKPGEHNNTTAELSTMPKLSYDTFLALRKGCVTRPPLVDFPLNEDENQTPTTSFKKLPKVEDLIMRPDLRPVSSAFCF